MMKGDYVEEEEVLREVAKKRKEGEEENVAKGVVKRRRNRWDEEDTEDFSKKKESVWDMQDSMPVVDRWDANPDPTPEFGRWDTTPSQRKKWWDSSPRTNNTTVHVNSYI